MCADATNFADLWPAGPLNSPPPASADKQRHTYKFAEDPESKMCISNMSNLKTRHGKIQNIHNSLVLQQKHERATICPKIDKSEIVPYSIQDAKKGALLAMLDYI